MEPVVARSTDPQGVAGAFEARLEAHRGIVWKIAGAWCPAGEERDDLAQEILLQLWRAWPRYDPARTFSTWMYRVALNTAISFGRSAGVRRRATVPLEPEIAERAEAPPAGVEDDRPERLRLALAALGDLDRALVVLHLEERSHREIAEILGLSESNVGTKLSRLKQRLRREAMASPQGDRR